MNYTNEYEKVYQMMLKNFLPRISTEEFVEKNIYGV